MFDPALDDAGGRPYYRRLLVIGALTVMLSLGLWPSISGFAAGPEAEHICFAIRDGWASEPHDPGPRASIAAQNAYLDWRRHAGACVDASRRRLVVSGVIVAGVCLCLSGAVRMKHGGRRNARVPLPS